MSISLINAQQAEGSLARTQLSVTVPDIKCYAQLVQKILIGINISVVTSMIDGMEQLEMLSHTVKQGRKPVDSVAHRTRLNPRHHMVRTAAQFSSGVPE
jgi:hypothetical protein